MRFFALLLLLTACICAKAQQPDTLRGAQPGNPYILMGQQYINVDSSSYYGWLSAGSGYLLNTDYTMAAQYLQRASEIGPDSFEAVYNYGLSLSWLGRDSLAAIYLEQAHALDPKDPDVQYALLVAQYRSGNYLNAERMGKLLVDHPQYGGDARRFTASSIYRTGGKKKKACYYVKNMDDAALSPELKGLCR